MSKYIGLYMDQNKAEIYKNNIEKDFLLKRSLKVTIVKNGVVLPSKEMAVSEPIIEKKLWAMGGVVNEEGEYVEESELGKLWGGKYEYSKGEEEFCDEDVLFMGPFVAHWGHYICDEISRLWYFVENPGNYKIVYCSWLFGQDISSWKIYGNYLEILQLLGIKESQLLNITKPMRFRTIIIPEISFVSRQYYSVEYKRMIRKIINNAKECGKTYPKRVYFTRQNFEEAKNKEYGEEEFERFFSQNGFKLVSPEKLSVREQIGYFQNSETVAMVAGTISHNLIFARESIKAIILNKMSIDNAYQIIVDHVAEAQITYIDAYFKGLPVLFGAGPFWLIFNKYVNKWARKERYKGIRKNRKVLRGIIWYIKKYKEIYGKDKEMRELLKSQQNSLRALRKQMKDK